VRIATTRLEIVTDVGVSLADITGDVNVFIAAKGVARGLCIVTLEPEDSGLSLAANLDDDMEDLLRLGRRHLPPSAATSPRPRAPVARADRADVEEPGYSPAGIMAYCLSLAIRQGGLHLGNWDAVVLIDAAGPRRHPVDVILMGP
jgi:thiamine phosphate synthase YjbQ (UPF0047 family)